MPPPQYEIDNWKKHKNWAHRFMLSSFALNSLMCGTDFDKSNTSWNEENMRKFNNYMKRNAQTLTRKKLLYRGTTVKSPTMNPFSNEMINCQYMSCSKSKEIGIEFISRKKGLDGNGYLHVFQCCKGVKIYDMKDKYKTFIFPLKREKEVIILPNHHMKLIKEEKNILYWIITN
jgi:hypothetical protein